MKKPTFPLTLEIGEAALTNNLPLTVQQHYPLIKPIPERGLKAGRRILRKNSLPATHMIIAWWNVYQPEQSKMQKYDDLHAKNYCSGMNQANVIAVFKIRLK